MSTANLTRKNTNSDIQKLISAKSYEEFDNLFASMYDINILKAARQKTQMMSKESQDNLITSISWSFIPDNLKKQTRERIQANMKIVDIFTLIFASIGLISNIIASSLYITFEKYIDGNFIEVIVTGKGSNLITILRWITTVSTCILIILIIVHYNIRLNFQIFKQKLEVNSNIFTSNYIFYILMEIFVCGIHTPPYIEGVKVPIATSGEFSKTVNIDLDLILSIIIPLRIYLLFRYYSFYSPWADDKAEKVCNDCNTEGGISFAIKAELKERPYFVVCFLMIVSIMIFGYGLRNVELAFINKVDKRNFQDWTFIWNGFWCIIITILTVGYGDYYPQTHLGRMIAVVACLWGTFLISLMVVSLTMSVEFTSQEEKAYEELKKNDLNDKLISQAAQLIRISHNISKLRKKNKSLNLNKEEELNTLNKELNECLRDFTKTRKKILTIENEISSETILYKLNTNINEQMESIINLCNFHISSLLDYIKVAKILQSHVADYSYRLENLTKGLYDCIQDENVNSENSSYVHD